MRSVATRVTADRGFELVDVEMKRGPDGLLVRLYVDKPGGIGLDDLQSVSTEVSAILDAEDPIEGRYTLEVSSPGLDRPLKTEDDYRRFVGPAREALELRAASTGAATGRAGSSPARAGVVTLDLEKGQGEALVPLSKVSHGRLEVEFPKHG